MHRDRKEDCVITFSTGKTYAYSYAEQKMEEAEDDN
jgi:hypothetical protein